MSISLTPCPEIYFPNATNRIWPSGQEHFNRLAFTVDGAYGAFLTGPTEVILFAIKDLGDKIEVKPIEKTISSNKQICTIAFGPKRRNYNGLTDSVNHVKNTKFDPEAYLFATSHVNGSILLWDTTGLLLTTMEDNDRPITEMIFTPRKAGMVQLLTVSFAGKLKVWDFQQTYGYNMSQTKNHPQPLHCLAWAEGGHLVATAGTGMVVYVYKMGSVIEERIHEFRGHLSCVVSCQFSSDDTTLVTASLDTRINLWDCLNGQLRQTFCHAFPVPQFIFGQNQVRSVGVTRSGTSVITITDDRKLSLWNPHDVTQEVEHPPTLPYRVTVPSLPLKINPELSMVLKENGSSHAFTMCKGGRWIGVTSLNSDALVLYTMNSRVPTLGQMCRDAVRKSIAHIQKGVDLLPIPETLKDYLNYNNESYNSHFYIDLPGQTQESML